MRVINCAAWHGQQRRQAVARRDSMAAIREIRMKTSKKIEKGIQRSSVCRGQRGGTSGVCGCDCRVAKGGGAQGGGSAVVGSSRGQGGTGTEGRAVGEGVV